MEAVHWWHQPNHDRILANMTIPEAPTYTLVVSSFSKTTLIRWLAFTYGMNTTREIGQFFHICSDTLIDTKTRKVNDVQQFRLSTYSVRSSLRNVPRDCLQKHKNKLTGVRSYDITTALNLLKRLCLTHTFLWFLIHVEFKSTNHICYILENSLCIVSVISKLNKSSWAKSRF